MTRTTHTRSPGRGALAPRSLGLASPPSASPRTIGGEAFRCGLLYASAVRGPTHVRLHLTHVGLAGRTPYTSWYTYVHVQYRFLGYSVPLGSCGTCVGCGVCACRPR